MHGEDKDAWIARTSTKAETGLTEEELQIDGNKKIIINSRTKKEGIKKITVFWPAKLKSFHTKINLSHEFDGYLWMNIHEAISKYNFPESRKILTEIDQKLRSDLFHC